MLNQMTPSLSPKTKESKLQLVNSRLRADSQGEVGPQDEAQDSEQLVNDALKGKR